MAVIIAPGHVPEQPLTHARVLWQALAGAVSATSAAGGYPAERAAAVDTASWWLPAAAPASWSIRYDTVQTVDAVGIAAHELAGAEVRIAALLAGVWQDLATLTPADNSAILVLLPRVETTSVRVSIDGVAPVGVIYTGRVLALPVPEYTALPMLDLCRQATLTSYVSEGGQLLARFVQRQGRAGTCAWRHLPEDWYRTAFDPFARAALTEPFFLAARPGGYPEDCVYGWVDAPIVPSRMGVKTFLSVSFEVQAHAPSD